MVRNEPCARIAPKLVDSQKILVCRPSPTLGRFVVGGKTARPGPSHKLKVRFKRNVRNAEIVTNLGDRP